MGKAKTNKPAPEGVLFPCDPKKSVSPETPRSSTFGNKAAWAAAAAAVDDNAAQRILKEKNWRQNYDKYVVEHVKLSLQSSDAALKIARAGLKYCYSNFEFLRSGTLLSLDEAMKKYTAPLFKTGFIRGTLPKPKPTQLSVPFHSQMLSNDSLIKQLQNWANTGIIEPSARDALEKVVKNQETWLDLSDKYFVLLGAGSAMGPFPILMALGANVIAVDLNRKQIWKRLIDIAKNSPGTLTFPLLCEQEGLSEDQICENSGCNLITQTPEVRNWLLELYPGKDLVVGCYAYLDGEMHVKVSLAMDAIVRDLAEKRKAACAYLCTPTDVHVIPPAAATAQKENLGALTFPFSLFSFILTPNSNKPITPATSSLPLNYVDAIVIDQGPNYILAKRIQHWRALVSRFDTQVTVSSNIAPSTKTVSVLHNKMFKLAYAGFKYFGIEVFEQETSNAVMTGLLIYDLRSEDSVANPKQKTDHPLLLFTGQGMHGGIWRLPFKFGSIGIPAGVLALIRMYMGVLGIFGIISVGVTAWLLM